MRQTATRDVLNAQVSDLFSAFDGDIARNLDQGAIAYDIACFFHHVVRHIVEHDDVGASGECLADFVE